MSCCSFGSCMYDIYTVIFDVFPVLISRWVERVTNADVGDGLHEIAFNVTQLSVPNAPEIENIQTCWHKLVSWWVEPRTGVLMHWPINEVSKLVGGACDEIMAVHTARVKPRWIQSYIEKLRSIRLAVHVIMLAYLGLFIVIQKRQ